MQENPPKLPPGVVEDMPPDDESRLGNDLGTTAKVTWSWLKSKYGKPRTGELGYDRAYDRDYYNGKIGRLYINVRPYDDRGQWLPALDQEFTADGLRDAQKYGFYLLQEHPEVHGFWLTGMLDIYWTKLGRSEARRAMDLGVYQRAQQTRNPRKRAGGLTEGASGDNANRRREGAGRFLKSTPCDFCGKSCAAEHFTDERACGGGDGPGFYLCGKATCERSRAKLEREQGFPALKHHYVEQRRKNDAMNRGKTKAFLDGPRGTEIQLTNLRRQQDIVARRLSEATEDYKIEMLQKKERDLQEQIDKLVFGDEHVPNHSAVHYVWLIDYRGVPMDTEGPYGPMSIDRASSYARIGAKEGDHDRAVSIGTDIMSDGFEILRRYRRGTGERIL